MKHLLGIGQERIQIKFHNILEYFIHGKIEYLFKNKKGLYLNTIPHKNGSL